MRVVPSLKEATAFISHQISEIEADIRFGIEVFRELLAPKSDQPSPAFTKGTNLIAGLNSTDGATMRDLYFRSEDHHSPRARDSFGEATKRFGGKPIEVADLTKTVIKSLGKDAALVIDHAREKGAPHLLWTLHLLHTVHERKLESASRTVKNTAAITELIQKVDSLVVSKGDKTLALVAQMADAVEDSRRRLGASDRLGELLDKMCVYRRSINALSDALHGLNSMDPFRAFENVRASFPKADDIPAERKVAPNEKGVSDGSGLAPVRVKSSGGPVMTTDQIFHIYNPENPGMRTYFSGEQAYNNLLEEWRPDLAAKLHGDKSSLRSEVASAVDRALAELNLTEFLEEARKASASEVTAHDSKTGAKTTRSDRERALVEDLQVRINELLSKYDQMISPLQNTNANTVEGLVLTQSSGSIFNAMRKEADQYPEDIQLGLKVIDHPLFEFSAAQRQIMAAGLISAYMMRRYISKEPVLAPYIADLKWFDQESRSHPNSEITKRFNFIHAQILPLREIINETGGEATYAQVGQVLGATRLSELREEVVRERHMARRIDFDKALSTFRHLFQSEEQTETGSRWRWHPGFSAPGIRRDALKDCIYFRDYGYGRPIVLSDLAAIKRAIMREQFRAHPKAYFQTMPIADADAMERAVIVADRKWRYVERQLDEFLKQKGDPQKVALNPINPGAALDGFKPRTLGTVQYQLSEEFEAEHGLSIDEVLKRAKWFYSSHSRWERNKEEWLHHSDHLERAASVGLVAPAKNKDESSFIPELVTLAKEWAPIAEFSSNIELIERVRCSPLATTRLWTEWPSQPYLHQSIAEHIRDIVSFGQTFERISAVATPESLALVEAANKLRHRKVLRGAHSDGELVVSTQDCNLTEKFRSISYYDPESLTQRLNSLILETIPASDITPRWIACMRDLISNEGQAQIEAKGLRRFGTETIEILKSLRLPAMQEDQMRIERTLYQEIEMLASNVQIERKPSRRSNWIGSSYHFIWKDNEPVATFGKVREVKLWDIKDEYLSYICRSNFPAHVQTIAKLELERRAKKTSQEEVRLKLLTI